MLTLTREKGESIYLGRRLLMSDPDGSCDYRIDFEVVDHHIGSRRIEVLIVTRDGIERHTLTPAQPDLDFGPDIRLAFLKSHEYCKNGVMTSVARVGIRAPNSISILRDNATPLLLNRSRFR
jgi:hypothetical protein